MKEIAILGGTGFVGSYIVDELLSCGYRVKMINRKIHSIKTHKNISQVSVNMKSDKLYQELKNCSCLIYNIGIIREFPKDNILFKDLHQELAVHAIEMSKKAGIKKFILMSANGVDKRETDYEETKFQSERYLMKSDLDWTIIRPSLIFGDPNVKMEFCTQMRDEIIATPFPIPLFFNGFNILRAGSFKLSPIHAKNVAQFFIESVSNDETSKKIFEIGGTTSLTWIEIMHIISKACKKKKLMIPVPLFAINLVAALFDRFRWFPITRSQIKMLIRGNTCESQKYYSKFGIKELNFTESNLEYLSIND